MKLQPDCRTDKKIRGGLQLEKFPVVREGRFECAPALLPPDQRLFRIRSAKLHTFSGTIPSNVMRDSWKGVTSQVRPISAVQCEERRGSLTLNKL
jgi:hypothetical protein